ncbi:MAG TPA: adenylate/guanylate cyclase domain-containing protein [Saprospiraceae bacterium]|nr:adenylate/guanylate cyclase domain-containing protein [Saprospiraceae bacterium]HMQ85306.1 adenylate/guanylate cyclase domain-containing protein [Saprospiraceae bacterium]
MKKIALFFFFGFAFFTLQAQSIEALEKDLQDATSSKDKLLITYQLAEAYLRSSTDKSIEYAKKAYQMAKDQNNSGMEAKAAFLTAQGYERDRNDSNAEVWYRTALTHAKEAKDSDLIIKSVEKRSRLATKDRDYRKAYQIVEEAFTYFSQNGTSIVDLENNYDQKKSSLEKEKNALEKIRESLESEVDELRQEKGALENRQVELEAKSEKTQKQLNEQVEKLEIASEAQAQAEKVAQEAAVQVKSLSRENLEKEAVLKSKEAEINKAKAELAEAQLISERAENERQQLTIMAVAGIAMASLLLILFISARRSRHTLSEKNKTIKMEQERSEELLLNILPKTIADELKENKKVKARKYDEVTVLFSDFKNFTKISEQLTPEELVEELDKCFKAFDFILDQYDDIEKIKTIGDAYMCASGLNGRRTMPHNIIRAALEMQQFLEEQKKEKIRLGKPYFEARIGIHTGSVVAGVVGVNKFAYDIWGDTVNIAARMETESQEGRVNISDTTFGLIKYKFDCEYRGKVAAKNKGYIDMYFVKKEKVEAAVMA